MGWLDPLKSTWLFGSFTKTKAQNNGRRGKLTDDHKKYIQQHWKQMSYCGMARACGVNESCIRKYLKRRGE